MANKTESNKEIKDMKETGFTPVGKNVEMKVERNILTLRVDISADFGLSQSGKTLIVASTAGNMAIPGHENIKIGVNAFKGLGKDGAKAPKEPKAPKETFMM